VFTLSFEQNNVSLTLELTTKEGEYTFTRVCSGGVGGDFLYPYLYTIFALGEGKCSAAEEERILNKCIICFSFIIFFPTSLSIPLYSLRNPRLFANCNFL
jgi:hypothetical protein